MKWQRVKYQPNTPLGANGQKVTASKAHTELSKQAAKEGMVLLKNENSLLPFEKGTRLAVFGKASADYVKGGGGSGDVTVSYTVSLDAGLRALSDYVSVYEGLSSFYNKNVTIVDTVTLDGLTKGTKYQLKGWQMVKSENAQLLVDSKPVENDYTFTAKKSET